MRIISLIWLALWTNCKSIVEESHTSLQSESVTESEEGSMEVSNVREVDFLDVVMLTRAMEPENFALEILCEIRRAEVDLGGGLLDYKCRTRDAGEPVWSDGLSDTEQYILSSFLLKYSDPAGVRIYGRVACRELKWKDQAPIIEESKCALKVHQPKLDLVSSKSGQIDRNTLSIVELKETKLVAGQSPELRFRIPDSAVGFLLQIHGSKNHYFHVDELIAPDGLELVGSNREKSMVGLEEKTVQGIKQVFGQSQAFLSLNRSVSMFPGFTNLLVPNHIHVQAGHQYLTPGEWKFRLAAQASDGQGGWLPVESKAKVKIFVRQADIPSDRGRLLVHVHFAEYGGLSFSEVMTGMGVAAEFQDIFDKVAEKFLDVGIELEFRWHDSRQTVALPVGQALSIADIRKGLARIKNLEPGVHVIQVAGVLELPQAAALSIGLPGSYEAGQLGEGVTFHAGMNPATVVMQLAHEIGHYLGLFHERESFLFQVYDQLEDTANAHLMVSDNLNTASRFSREQGWVMRMHPLVQWPGIH